MDPFVAGLASSMIKPNLDNALHRGHAFMQTNFGFLSSSALHYHFNINGEYGTVCWVGVNCMLQEVGLYMYDVCVQLFASHTHTYCTCTQYVRSC